MGEAHVVPTTRFKDKRGSCVRFRPGDFEKFWNNEELEGVNLRRFDGVWAMLKHTLCSLRLTTQGPQERSL